MPIRLRTGFPFQIPCSGHGDLPCRNRVWRNHPVACEIYPVPNHVTRIDVQSVRRAQIVEAAAAIIAEQGLQNLSLSEIEKRAGMSRGQLTYYFPSKESILLAVFDHLLQMTYQRIGTPPGTDCAKMSCWDWVRHLLERIIAQGPVNTDFHALQYTFLSQIGHREDFRKRLANLYEEWRTNLAAGLTKDTNRSSSDPSPRAIASIVQALLHGLAMQVAADPGAFDRQEMVELCMHMLGQCVGQNGPTGHNGDAKRVPAVRPGRSEIVR